MQELILFILTFVLVFIIYKIIIFSKTIRHETKKKKNNVIENYYRPMEVKYLVNRYKLDLSKIHYGKLLNMISLVSALDLSIIITLASISDNFYIQLLIAFISMIPIILISYHLVYLHYKKKGMIKND